MTDSERLAYVQECIGGCILAHSRLPIMSVLALQPYVLDIAKAILSLKDDKGPLLAILSEQQDAPEVVHYDYALSSKTLSRILLSENFRRVIL